RNAWEKSVTSFRWGLQRKSARQLDTDENLHRGGRPRRGSVSKSQSSPQEGSVFHQRPRLWRHRARLSRASTLTRSACSLSHLLLPVPSAKYRIGVVPSCFRNIDINALGLL